MSSKHACQLATLALLAFAGTVHPASLTLERRGTFLGGAAAASEIVAYDAATRRMFVTNGALNRIDIINMANVDAPVFVSSIDVSSIGPAVNSVASKNGVVAIAIENATRTNPGSVALYDANGTQLRVLTAGAQPDHVSFSPNGQYVLVANEGEPTNIEQPLEGINPAGSVTIVSLAQN